MIFMGTKTISDLQPKSHTENEKEVLHNEKRELKKKNRVKYLRQVICILVMGLIISASVLNVTALKIQIPNVIKYNVFNTEGYKDDDVNIAYIPKGFELAQSSNSDTEIYRSFKNGDMWFDVSRTAIKDEYNINMENMEFERLEINGNDAVLLTKPELTILFWADNENAYMLNSNLTAKEVLKIGRSTMR